MRASLFFVFAAVAAAGTQQPIFRVQAELVRIDVLVERNGKPLSGLTAADFTIEDNGVPQHVDLLPDTDSVTISTVLDVSGSMTASKLNNAAAGVRAVIAALDDRDRHTVYAFAGDVRRIPLPPVGDALYASSIAQALRMSRGVHTSLFDALFAAIVETDNEAGPKLAAVLTDGRNNTSWLTADAVIDSAIRHETVIYPVHVGQESRHYPFGVPPMVGDDGLRLLQVVAERTGGRLIHADWSKNLGIVFDALLREYRQRYILSFTPERVGSGDGWHRLAVKLRNRPGNVHARRGYWSR